MNATINPIDKPGYGSGVGRRAFIRGGLSGALMLLTMDHMAIAGQFASAAAPGAPLHLDRMVYDRRFTAAQQVGERMAAHGVALSAIDGDITQLWTDILKPQWNRDRVAIAGVTTPASLFCLEQMGAECRMRVAVRLDIAHKQTSLRAALVASETAAVLRHWTRETVPARSVRMHGENDCLVAWIMTPVDSGGRTRA